MNVLTQEKVMTLQAYRRNPEDPYDVTDPEVISVEEDILPWLGNKARELNIPAVDVSADEADEQKITLKFMTEADVAKSTMDIYPESVEEKLAIVTAINGVLQRNKS